VLKSLKTKINVPFVIRLSNKKIQLVSKTVMRKASFLTPNKEMKV